MRAAHLICALTLLTNGVWAQETHGPYLGVSYGTLEYEDINLEDEGYPSYSESADQLRLIGGFRLNKRLAVEASWARAADVDMSFSRTANGPFMATINYSIMADIDTVAVRTLGTIPFQRLSLFGGAGYYGTTIDGTYFHDGGGWFIADPSPLDTAPWLFEDLDHSGITLAGGLQFDFDKGPALRAEFEYFFTPSDVELNAINVSVLYTFGQNQGGN